MTSNADHEQILGVWSARDQEENIRLLLLNCALPEFPFPPVIAPTTSGQIGSDCESSPGRSCLPPPKRRRRRRKARLTEAEKEEKRRKFLERNRLPARKCRTKKKHKQHHLEEMQRTLEQQNLVLRIMSRDLWNKVCLYGKTITMHASCNCPGIVELVERYSKLKENSRPSFRRLT